ncbi:MAG: hypothetical protein ABR973_01960 [Candidatus Acidiferrales bacterium]|jgi:hypothetical protein
MKRQVQFGAHKQVSRRTAVEFTTREGKDVEFRAKKKVKVPVHVSFKANVKK